jgi:type IX secretion system substrate protein
MRTKIFLLIFLVVTSICFSQKQDRIWCFPQRLGLNFNDTANPVVFNSAIAQNSNVSCASIADKNGNLLFYMAGTDWDTLSAKVWNRNHVVMQNGDSLAGQPNRAQACLIIPFPSDSNKYYLFSWYYISAQITLGYSVVDMTQDGGLGAVIQKNIFLMRDSLSEKLQAVKHGNGRDWWVLMRKYTDNTYYKYLVTPTGISGPFTQQIGTSNGYMWYGDMIFSPQGDKLVAISPFAQIDLMDFNRCTGELNNFIDLGEHVYVDTNAYYWGAFSQDGSKLYAVISPNCLQCAKRVYQYDLTATDIMNSKVKIFSYTDSLEFLIGTPRLAPDGKIYIPKGWTTHHSVYDSTMDIIEDPDMPGFACNYCSNCLSLPTWSMTGLPNNPNYNLGPLTASGCDTLDIGIAENKFDDKNWNLFPNPFWKKTTLTFNEYCSSCSLDIYDAMGRKTFATNFTGSQIEIERSTIGRGLYFFSVYNKRRTVIAGKLVVE